MPDVAIVNSNVTLVPADYIVPGASDLAPKAVRASFDGTGAGGPYLPALQLLDPAGHVMWTAVDTSAPVAAGASVDVSWFPDVSQSGSGSTTTQGATAYLWGVFAAQTIPTLPGNASVRWAHFQTNNTSIFGTDTAAVAFPPFHNTTGDTYLQFIGNGSYVAAGGAQLAAGAYAQSVVIDNPRGQWQIDEPGSAFYVYENEATNTDAYGTAGNQQPSSRKLYFVDGNSGPGAVSLLVQQNSGAAKGLVSVALGMIYGNGGTGTLTQIY